MSGEPCLTFQAMTGVADHANAVGVGDHDGTVEKAGVVDPGSACHFAIAVESEPGGEDGVVAGFSARMNGRDASTNWSLADFEFTFRRR